MTKPRTDDLTPTEIPEDVDPRNLLRENVEGELLYLIEDVTSFEFKVETLTESRNHHGDPVIRAEGEFGFCDKPTQNKRVYSRNIYTREVKRLGPVIEAGRLLGELDHPDDGRTRAQRAAIRITKLEIQPNGRVWGAFEVLSSKVPNAKTLRGLVESGVELGVSSRGLGSVKKNRQGLYEVQNDYKLLGFDVVVDPAWADALPKYTVTKQFEPVGQTEVMEEEVMPKDLERTKRENPELVEAVRADLRAEYEAELERKKKSLESQVADTIERATAKARQQVAEDFAKRAANSGDNSAEVLENMRELMKPTYAPNELSESQQAEMDRLRTEASDYRAEVKSRGDRIATLERKLEEAEMARLVAQHVPYVVEEHVQQFFNLLGEASDYPTAESFERRLAHVVEEFWTTDRYIENPMEANEDLTIRVENLIERLAEGEEVVAEAGAYIEALEGDCANLSEALEERTNLLQQATIQLSEARRQNAALSRRLEEGRDLVSESLAELDRKDDLLRESMAEIASYIADVEELTEDRDELEVSLHRHQLVIGASHPVSLLEELERGNSIEDVDSIFESVQGGRRKPADYEPSSGQRTQQTITEGRQGGDPHQGPAENRTRKQILERFKAVNAMDPRDASDETRQIVESATNGNGGAAGTGPATTRAANGRKRIHGLSPEKMKSMVSL